VACYLYTMVAQVAFAVFVTIFSILFSSSSASAQRGDAANAPYQLAQRPMPKGTDLEVLLPRTVGTFTRAPLPPGTKTPVDEDLNVDYSSGTEKVNVGFSIPGNPNDAHEAIRIAREETIATLKKAGKGKELQQAQESIGTPTSYYKVQDFIAWSRGGYFFYAKANSAAALDAFMRAFPF
jgi:hypothetical protein